MTESKLSVKHTTDLLRLYLIWPERIDKLNEEAERFSGWLNENHPERSVVSKHGNQESLSEFFSTHHQVVDACRNLKTDPLNDASNRLAQRLSLVAQAFLVVFDCQEEPALIGSTLRGIIIDVSETGIGVQTEREIPRISSVSVTMVLPGLPLTIYHLNADTRWCAGEGSRFQLGLEFFDSDDLERWKSDFFSKFLPI